MRVGEFAPAGVVDPPLILLGDTSRLRVRVDVDENDAWRVRPGVAARANLRGNPELAAPLEFVRVEPLVVPKQSLTGFGSERVDTRVLRVVFEMPRPQFPVYVGQLVDVRIQG